MAYTARAEADCKEFFDDPDTLGKKIKKLAKLVKRSKHLVAFTGAGISTSAGIADFRSGINTVLDTGAGQWAKNAALKQGKTVKKAKHKIRSTLKAYPTPAHMALVQLMKSGYLKYLVSQNTDGLHRRSGIAIDRLSELHGNSTLEVCELCKKEYMRDYRCRGSMRKCRNHKDHFTGRYCSVNGCNGKLNDTIVNFGETVRYDPLALALGNSEKADLYLTLGSSLTVSPANRMPLEVGKKWKEESDGNIEKVTQHNLCVVNLQKTDLHDAGLVSLPIFAKIDDVMIGLMKELELTIPEWELNRYVKICIEQMSMQKKQKQTKLIISGVDSDGTNFEVFKSVQMQFNGNIINRVNVDTDKMKKQFTFMLTDWKKTRGIFSKLKKDKILTVHLGFRGNYKEPNLVIDLCDYLKDLIDCDGDIVLKLSMDPVICKWRTPQFYDVNDISYGTGKQEIVLMKIYKTSYGYDGVNTILFANNKSNDSLPSPDQLTKYLSNRDKFDIKWIDGKTGKEDLTAYTAFYHHFGLLFCYFYDYYVPVIKMKLLSGIIDELYGIDFTGYEAVLNEICEFEGMCVLMNDFLVGDWMNPYPFYRDLMISRMWNNIDKFANGWHAFLTTHSKHRQIAH